MEKPAKDTFDPKDFLAKVGTGKTILEFQKNQNVFEQGDVADTVFYLQKGKVKLTAVSDQGKEAVVAISRARPVFRRRLHEWSPASRRNHDGDGRLLDHCNHEGRDGCRNP